MRTSQLARTLGGIALGAAVAVLTGISGMASAQELTTVRFGDQVGSEVDYAAIWVAEQNGYFEEEGIQLERMSYANGPSTLLDLGNLDAVTAAIAPYMQFIARGGEVTMVMSLTKGNAPIIGKKEYTSVKDLDGQKVGVPGIGTIHDAVLAHIEQLEGIKVQHVPAKISDLAQMMRNGEVEAFIGWEPASAAAVHQNPELMHYIQRMPPIENAESLELAFRPGFIEENPEVAQKFVNATLRGIRWIEDNSAEDLARLLSEKMNDPDSYEVNLDALQSVDLTKPRIDMPSTEIWLTTIAEQGKIPEELVENVEEWVMQHVDYSLLEKAEADLANQ